MEEVQWLQDRVKALVRWDGCFLSLRIDEIVINSFFGDEGRVPEEGLSLAIKDSTHRLIMCNRFAKSRGIYPYKTLETLARRIDPAIEIICTSKKDSIKGKREKGEDDDGFKEIRQKKDKIKAILAEYDPKINELPELKADQVVLDLSTALAQRRSTVASSHINDKLLLSLVIQEISTYFKSYFNTNIEMGFGHSSLIATFATGRLSFEDTYFAPAFAPDWTTLAQASKDKLVTEYFKRVALVTELQDLQGIGEKTQAELNSKNIMTPWDIQERLLEIFEKEGFSLKLVSWVCNLYGVDKKEAPGLIEERKRHEQEKKKLQKQALRAEKAQVMRIKPIYPDSQERKRPLKPKIKVVSTEVYKPDKVEFEMLRVLFVLTPSKLERDMICTLKTAQRCSLDKLKKVSSHPKEKFAVKRNPRMIIVQTRMTRGALPDPRRSAEKLADQLYTNLLSENVVSRMLKLTAKLGLRDKPIYHSFIKVPNKQATGDAQQLLVTIMRDDIFARSDAGTPITELKVSALKLVDRMTFQVLLAKEAAKELNTLISKKHKRRRTGSKRSPRELTATEQSIYSLLEIGRSIDCAATVHQKARAEQAMLVSLAGLDLTGVERPEHFDSLIRVCQQRQHLVFEGLSFDPAMDLLRPDQLLSLEPKNPPKQKSAADLEKSPLRSLQKDAPTNFKIDQFFAPKPPVFDPDPLQTPEDIAAAVSKLVATSPQPGLSKRVPQFSNDEFGKIFPQYKPNKMLSGRPTEDASSAASGSVDRGAMKITKEGDCRLI